MNRATKENIIDSVKTVIFGVGLGLGIGVGLFIAHSFMHLVF